MAPDPARHLGPDAAQRRNQAPGGHRPIFLRSIIYRIWARGRGAPFRRWLVGRGVLQTGGKMSAEVQATALAWTLELAKAHGCPVSGLTTDWSHCYDRIHHALLPWAARAAGVPQEL